MNTTRWHLNEFICGLFSQVKQFSSLNIRCRTLTSDLIFHYHILLYFLKAQFIAQSIGQAFQVAYVEFLKANGIEDHSFVKEMDYQEVLNSQEIFGNELALFAKKELQKEVRRKSTICIYLLQYSLVRIVRDLCLMKWFQLKISNFAIFLVHSTSFHISKIWKILKFLVGTFHQAWKSYLYLCVYSTSQTRQVNTHSVSKSRFNLNVNLPRDPIRWRDVTRQCPFLGRSKVILLLY